MAKLNETASQTAGPYLHIGCMPNYCGISDIYPNDLGHRMIHDATLGDRISVTGSVFDGAGNAATDSMVEIWQADSKGIYPGQNAMGDHDPNFSGWGRSAGAAETGEWRFETIKPGPVKDAQGRMMAPHISFWIVARGINIGLHTRMYFPDEEAANAQDPILARIEHKNRIPTLIGKMISKGEYQFNINLQGPDETVFFDV